METQVTVNELAHTVVKGTRLQHPTAIAVDESGLQDDRLFQLVRNRDHMQINARNGPLSQVDARWDGDDQRLTFAFPDGSSCSDVIETGEPLDGLVSWDQLRPLPGRAIGGQLNDKLSDYLDEPVTLAETTAPNHGLDVSPVTLLSRASIARLKRELQVDRLSPERFRMNLILDGADEHEEDSWYGRQVAIGDVILRVTGPVPRCVAITHDPTTGKRDYPTLKVIDRYRGGIVGSESPDPVRLPFGVFAEVERTGTVAVGDRITLIDD